MAYEGVSIVDYLRSTGQPTDYASRATLAASKGIQGYVGSAQQNTQLLNMLRGGATGAPIAQPTATPQGTSPAPQPSAPSVPGMGGGDTELQQLAKTDRNPIQETRYQELLKQQPQGSSGTGIPTFTQPTIDLSALYEGLYASSGIKDIENELSAKSKAYTEQVAKIKDNPYLYEATMTGRLSKLQDKFNDDTKNIQNDIAMRKADIETKLNLQTKQFDIESQQAQQAFNQFNSLLSSGALDNASGEDIANITRATGISSSMIKSAIGVSQKKNAPKVNTQVIQVDDGKNISVVVIDQDTGEVINKQILSASKPKEYAPKEPKAASAGEQKASVLASINSYLRSQAAQNNISPEDLFQKLIESFPDAFDYINETWTPRQIRIANGEKRPYGQD